MSSIWRGAVLCCQSTEVPETLPLIIQPLLHMQAEFRTVAGIRILRFRLFRNQDRIRQNAGKSEKRSTDSGETLPRKFGKKSPKCQDQITLHPS